MSVDRVQFPTTRDNALSETAMDMSPLRIITCVQLLLLLFVCFFVVWFGFIGLGRARIADVWFQYPDFGGEYAAC
jgi:hypothetical protein